MFPEIAQASTPEQVYEAVLGLLRQQLNPERALVFYGYDTDDTLKARVALGIDVSSVYLTGDISLAILQETLEAGKGRVLVDAQEDPRFNERTSTLLSGIRSVLCCPVQDEAGAAVGLLYVDNRLQRGVFKDDQLPWIGSVGAAMSHRLSEL